MIQSFARRANKSVGEVEKLWGETDASKGYAYRVGTLKKMLSLSSTRRRLKSITRAARRVAVVKTDSSAIPFIAYDLDDSILYCMFTTNMGKWYGYKVPHNIWDSMAKAESCGNFFAKKVKPKFPFEYVLYTPIPTM
jgi:hypothetical protein